MKQEEKELLLKDLCARLPYQTVVKWREQDVVLTPVMIIPYLNEGCKPYLRPMSSMTEEEKMELCKRAYVPDEMKTLEKKIEIIEINAKNMSDFYNEHYFDYRGLIEKGLAFEAPEGMYNFN